MSNERQVGQVASHDPAFYEHCAHCDAQLVEEVWHPVVTDSDDGSVVALYSFCNDECRAAWDTEQ